LNHIENLLHLNTIVISNNTLTSLPSSLTTLSSLKKISAAHNQLTSSNLPDLTTLFQLREVKLNDNPELSELPQHLANWGKGTLTNVDFKGKRPPGLEILDLGNCGFKGWIDLQPLVGQGNIVNLVLKGRRLFNSQFNARRI
jgi:Leucine-rich repeat (LRR) protein